MDQSSGTMNETEEWGEAAHLLQYSWGKTNDGRDLDCNAPSRMIGNCAITRVNLVRNGFP
jgi:hypothetical protein